MARGLKKPRRKGGITGFAKFLIVVAAVGGIGSGVYYAKNNGLLDEAVNESKSSRGFAKKSKGVVKCVLSPFGGYAGGPYMNEGFQASKNSRFYKEYGIQIEFVVNEDQDATLQMWANDEVQLHWFTVGAMSTQFNKLQSYKPVFLFQTDWSRGGDAIVAKHGINHVSELRGSTIACVLNSPSHTAVLGLLKANNMRATDVRLVPCTTPTEAAQKFKSGIVDAAAVWAPDDQDCIKNVSGSKVLMSTRQATHIIADCFFVKKDVYEANKDIYNAIAECWIKGNGEINTNASNKQKAAQILTGFGDGLDAEYYISAIHNVRLTSYGDNKNFFGLDPIFTGVTGSKLYRNIARMYHDNGVGVGGAWEMVSVSDAVASMDASKFTSSGDYAESKVTFSQATLASAKTSEAFATSTIRINFPSGSAQLTSEARDILDTKLAPTLEEFSAVQVRLEGHTDSDGSPALNRNLSRKRAQAIGNYFVNEYGMDRNRFVSIGYGEDKPIASNSTSRGKADNRRVEVQLLQ